MNPYQDLYNQQQEHFHKVVKKATLWERKQKLKAIRKWLKDNQDFVIDELQKDFKKTREEVMISEIKPVISEIRDAIHNVRYWARDEHKKTPLTLLGTRARVIKEPKGVSLIIAPWNFPFNLAIGPLVSAVAAGCCAVVKPSENTPHAEKVIQRLISEVFEAKEVACVTGGVPETTNLLELKWDHIFFTGSPMVGSIVMGAAAKHLTSVTLELGGLNPVIIDEKANLKDAAKKLIWGKYLNCGQSCVSPNYVLVPETIAGQFKDELGKAYDKRFGTAPNPTNDFARVVNANHYGRVKQLIDASVAEGAAVLRGGTFDETDNYVAPTIIDGITTSSTIFKEEIFGPVLPLMTYRKVDEAIQIINSNEKPLALYVFSKSRKFAKHILQNTSAGTSVVNDTTLQFIHPNLPFGGVNHSGIGKAHGEYGYKEFTNERALLKQLRGLTTAQLIYPPFGAFKRFVVKAVTWWL
jgi:aldehyde dehydrogenase (NAD+)